MPLTFVERVVIALIYFTFAMTVFVVATASALLALSPVLCNPCVTWP